MNNLFTDKELSSLPLGFQFFLKPDPQLLLVSKELNQKEKRAQIDYYGTDKCELTQHYKPISKIIIP